MEFSDLIEDTGADDWLIPGKEISKGQLLKKTSRYNIYKANWFGDALYYEPVRSKPSAAQEDKKAQVELEELEARLASIKLRLDLDGSSESEKDCSSDCDSAYSSVSSSPQYHTKKLQSEFQFLVDSPSASCSSSFTSGSCSCTSAQSPETESLKQMVQVQANALSPAPVVLNRDSYRWASGARQEAGDRASSWLELNELRFVAHEGFMLFMGAVLEERDMQSTALVMQMNHPKAVALHYLLHATRLGSAPSVDRLFSSRFQRRPLGLTAKLNVCQQVTNAMTYLHDKDIVHGKLTSVNIYLEFNQRVKISLIDDDESAIVTRSSRVEGKLEFNLQSLTYLSPELIKTITVAQSGALVTIDTDQLTKKSDVFSFGTFLYELFEEKFPLSETRSASELIYQIGSHQMKSKNLANTRVCPQLIERIISSCWRSDPHERPHFRQLEACLITF